MGEKGGRFQMSVTDPNTMDMDCLTLSLVEHAHHMCENCCFIWHKKGCSTRSHPGCNCGHPADSWHTNLKPSQTAHARVVSTISNLAPISSCQDDPLDSFLKDITKTQGHDQIFCILRSIFNIFLDEQENFLANKTPAIKEQDESTRVLIVKAMPHISLSNYHVSF